MILTIVNYQNFRMKNIWNYFSFSNRMKRKKRSKSKRYNNKRKSRKKRSKLEKRKEKVLIIVIRIIVVNSWISNYLRKQKMRMNTNTIIIINNITRRRKIRMKVWVRVNLQRWAREWAVWKTMTQLSILSKIWSLLWWVNSEKNMINWVRN